MVEYKILVTKKEEKAWDKFLQECSRGHYGALSGWLHGFDVYGGKSHILTLQKNGTIIGGMGMVEMGKGPFRILSVLMGPILSEGYEGFAPKLIEQTRQYAQQLGVFLLQLKTPNSRNHQSPFLLPSIDWNDHRLKGWKEGYPFSVVGVPNVLYLVDLKNDLSCSTEWEETMLSSFKANTRRNIRRSIRNGLKFVEYDTYDGVRDAYNLIELNAKSKGYAVRSWEQFAETALFQIANKQAYMTAAIYDGKTVGAHYGIVAGKRYSCSMGGVKRLKKDLHIGYFLQWNTMKKAKQLGLCAYDFTSIGTPSIKYFKEGFHPTLINLSPPRYIVLSSWKFELFHKLFPLMKRNKAKLARILKR
ncbi:GNAT family N-acetyltransferase [Nitratifractor sp.]